MSDHEQISQVIHGKRATMSDSLRALMIKEQMSKSLVLFELLIRSFAHKKRVIWSQQFD